MMFEHPPIYDIRKTYEENVLHGPFFYGKMPVRKPPEKLIDFLGFKVNSRLGVPAGPLLTSKWVALAAKLGFDIPTYKTIRSRSYPSHPLPNVTFVSKEGQQTARPGQTAEITITNSFGMPSQSPDFLMEDIESANRALKSGQVMIVSVVGSPNQKQSLIQDFIHAASLAKDAGAKIIEANFSCPNVEKAEGILYTHAETVESYVRQIAAAIYPIPLIIKVGVFANEDQLKEMLIAAARGGARGICGINSVSMNISPPLDSHRKTSGVCGAAIRPAALQFIEQASRIIEEEKLGLTLLGCGGIMEAEHIEEFLDRGAHIAMSATGMMWDPYLAARYHERAFTYS